MSEDTDRTAFELYMGAHKMTKAQRTRHFARRDEEYINQAPREAWDAWSAALEWERQSGDGGATSSADKK